MINLLHSNNQKYDYLVFYHDLKNNVLTSILTKCQPYSLLLNIQL